MHILKGTLLTPLMAQSIPDLSSSHDNYGFEPQNAIATGKAASASLVFLSPPSYLTPRAPILPKAQGGDGGNHKWIAFRIGDKDCDLRDKPVRQGTAMKKFSSSFMM